MANSFKQMLKNGAIKRRDSLSNPTLKSIRIATYGEANSLNAELDAITESEVKELEEEYDE